MEEKENKNFEDFEEEGKEAGEEIEETEISENEEGGEKEQKVSNLKIFGILAGIIVGLFALVVGFLMFLGGGETKKPILPKGQASTQNQANAVKTSYQTQQQAQRSLNISEADIENIKNQIKSELEAKFSQALENLRAQMEGELESKLNEISSEIEDLKAQVENLKSGEDINKKEIEKIKNELQNIEKKVNDLLKINKSVKNVNYPVLGSLKVEKITPQYVKIDGLNYWIGDRITLTLGEGKQKEFTIVNIDTDKKTMLIVDDWGNKYIVKLISA